MIFCGAASFCSVDENDPATPSPRQPKPRGCKKQQSSSNKSPYSSRGLDKVSEVMSQLEAKREKNTTTTAGSDGTFAAVRLRDDPPSKKVAAEKSTKKPQALVSPLPQPEQSSSDSEALKETEVAEPGRKPEKKSFSLVGEESSRRWITSYNWLVVMTVILVCMMMFGRVFAICCTSVCWYLAPTFMATQENQNWRQRLIKKNDYPRIVSNNRRLMQPKKMQGFSGRVFLD